MQTELSEVFNLPSEHGSPSDLSGSSDQQLRPGYLVPLKSISVTHGIAYRERLVSADDLILGDSIMLRDEGANFSVFCENRETTGFKVFFDRAQVGKMDMACRSVRAVTLISEFGKAIQGRVLQDAESIIRGAFLLLEQCMPSSVEFTIIEATK
ncbi:hypothetical protein [Marimonas arenosa]|nr:hypothetical protein [Marimonas arenosa]